MERIEFEKAIKAKTVELELAMEFGRSKEELLKLYKQLKELHYQKIRLEESQSRKDMDLV
jgi:hypothetical protein